MNLYPAIDLHFGRCVRLQRGDREKETVYFENPIEAARWFVEQGATWLHVVDLNRAFGDREDNRAIIAEIVRAFPDVRVQNGGGIRTLEDMEALLDIGVQRLVLGTVAVKQPEVVKDALARLGGSKIAVALDAHRGKVATQGWLETHELSTLDFARQMAELGVPIGIYTDIARDGMLTGLDFGGLRELAQNVPMRFIASGGLQSLEDLARLRQLPADRIDGAILGRALYENQFELKDAIEQFG